MSPEPVFSALVEDQWLRLPQVYREEDAKNDWTFKRWLSGMGDVAGTVQALVDRIEYVDPSEPDAVPGDTSDLIDAYHADDAWLPWIAMVRGIDITAARKDGTERSLLVNSKYDSGSKNALKNIVATNLTGTKFVEVFDHTDASSARGAASMWRILIVTKDSEIARGYVDDVNDPDIIVLYGDIDPVDPDIALVPDNPDPGDPDIVLIDGSPSDVVKVIADSGGKPAGTVIFHRTVESFPDYTAWKSA